MRGKQKLPPHGTAAFGVLRWSGWTDRRPGPIVQRQAELVIRRSPLTGRWAVSSHHSLTALADQNDPDDWHETNRYGRPGPSPCSEAGLAFRGPFRLLWPRLLRLAAKAAAIQFEEFPVSCFPVVSERRRLYTKIIWSGNWL